MSVYFEFILVIYVSDCFERDYEIRRRKLARDEEDIRACANFFLYGILCTMGNFYPRSQGITQVD